MLKSVRNFLLCLAQTISLQEELACLAETIYLRIAMSAGRVSCAAQHWFMELWIQSQSSALNDLDEMARNHRAERNTDLETYEEKAEDMQKLLENTGQDTGQWQHILSYSKVACRKGILGRLHQVRLHTKCQMYSTLARSAAVHLSKHDVSSIQRKMLETSCFHVYTAGSRPG